MDAIEELAAARISSDTALTIGVFDGVHLGHRYLVDRVRSEAGARGLESAVLTFRNHPVSVLAPDRPVAYLSSLDERLELLQGSGVDHVVPLTFTRELSQLTAPEFVALLVEHLRMRVLLTGPDFAMGKGRGGTVPVLTRLGEEMGYEVVSVGPMAHEGKTVSTTAIKELLKEGDVARAAGLLGRPHRLTGPVVLGDQRGRGLGFPTANLDVPAGIVQPADGIYATLAWIDGERRESVSSIGVRPTFGELAHTVETFVLDFDQDLYGKTVSIELVQRLRAEESFETVDALVAQMHRDVDASRAVLAGKAAR